MEPKTEYAAEGLEEIKAEKVSFGVHRSSVNVANIGGRGFELVDISGGIWV